MAAAADSPPTKPTIESAQQPTPPMHYPITSRPVEKEAKRSTRTEEINLSTPKPPPAKSMNDNPQAPKVCKEASSDAIPPTSPPEEGVRTNKGFVPPPPKKSPPWPPPGAPTTPKDETKYSSHQRPTMADKGRCYFEAPANADEGTKPSSLPEDNSELPPPEPWATASAGISRPSSQSSS